MYLDNNSVAGWSGEDVTATGRDLYGWRMERAVVASRLSVMVSRSHIVEQGGSRESLNTTPWTLEIKTRNKDAGEQRLGQGHRREIPQGEGTQEHRG